MIVLHPLKGTRHADTDTFRISTNYKFAELLKKYIEIKGDECMLSRESLDATEPDLRDIKVKYAPTVTITIDCYTDLDASISGYNILCDSYNALVGTINYETYQQQRTPIDSLGYTQTNSLKYGTISDITYYIGYVTNIDDMKYLKNDENLDTLAKRIVEGSYGPPVKTVEDNDPVGNDDPYFYRIDTWEENETVDGCSGKILETLYSGLPVRYLSISSFPKADTNYNWHTPLTYTTPTTCLFIGSVRAQGGTATAYMKVGNTEYTEIIEDTTFRIVIFEAEVNEGDNVHIGVQGSGRLDYSGIWVSPKGTLGNLDDPRSTYSIFPPGYRSISRVSSAYNSADAIHIALTSAKTLIERAKDKTTPTIGSQLTQEEATSESSGGDSLTQFVFTALGYANALSGIMGILNEFSSDKLNIVDPTKINVDYKALENSISAIASVQKRTEMINAVNDIKNMAGAVGGLTSTAEEVTEQGKALAEKVQSKIEAKGEALKS